MKRKQMAGNILYSRREREREGERERERERGREGERRREGELISAQLIQNSRFQFQIA